MGATADRIEQAIARAESEEAFGPWPGATAWRTSPRKGRPTTYAVRLGDSILGMQIGFLHRRGFDDDLTVTYRRYGPHETSTEIGTVPATPLGRREGAKLLIEHHQKENDA